MAKKKDNDLQITTQKSKDQTTRAPLKTGCRLGCSGRVGSSCSARGTRRITLIITPKHLYRVM
jgi:hypothetical protein